jgi:hypothetical protein
LDPGNGANSSYATARLAAAGRGARSPSAIRVKKVKGKDD